MKKNTPPVIIVAALDWGLGHATRLVPVIRYLQQQPCTIILASAGAALNFWKKEFPDFEFLELPAYNPIYPKHESLNWSMAKQIPHFFSVIKKEYSLLKKWVDSGTVDAVISDNRYGFYSKKIPCVFITHQLNIQLPRYLKGISFLLKKINFSFIKKFSICWIPDKPDISASLGGHLSHEKNLPFPIRYIGWVSQFRFSNATKNEDQVLILLSGPEPQRTALEDILLQEIKQNKNTFLLIRGNSNLPDLKNPPHNLSYENMLTGKILQEKIESAKWVICRAGYSSIMDLIELQKCAVIIPTPGQTEQLYLACEIPKKFEQFAALQQDDFSWEKLKDFCSKDKTKIFLSRNEENVLHKAIDAFLALL